MIHHEVWLIVTLLAALSGYLSGVYSGMTSRFQVYDGADLRSRPEPAVQVEVPEGHVEIERDADGFYWAEATYDTAGRYCWDCHGKRWLQGTRTGCNVRMEFRSSLDEDFVPERPR